jgi:hypothetical protein
MTLNLLRRLLWARRLGHIIPRQQTTKLLTVRIMRHTTGKFSLLNKLLVLTMLFRIWFRPRVLRNVERVDYSTTILGQKTTMPVYIVNFVPFYHITPE